MQRRAAAIYFALFVLIGAGTFGFIQVGTSQPDVRLDAQEYSSGDTLTVQGTEYTIADIGHAESDGDGHGGGGDSPIVGTLTWTNESSVSTATLDNGSTTTYQGDEYEVHTDGDAAEFTLVETTNVTALLLADDSVENELATKNGTDYVVFQANDSIQQLSTWVPEPDREGPFAEGGSFEYQSDDGNVSATISAVTADGATLSWQSSADREAELSEGGNVTLGSTQYFAHFTGDKSVQLVPTDQYWAAYQSELDYEDAWFERHAGLWAVVIASFMAAIILLASAYMPVRS